MAGQTRVEPKLTQKCLHVACHANILHHLPNGRVGNQRGGLAMGSRGGGSRGKPPWKEGAPEEVTFACKIGRARMSKVASSLFVVAVALGYEVVLFTKTKPPGPRRQWKTLLKSTPLKIHYFWCFLPWCSSCVLRLADLACPFGHFRVHVDKPSDPHHTASFNTRRHCPVLNPWPPFLGQCVCYAFVWHSIRKWRFLVNVCQSQSPSPWVSVWARERATATAKAKAKAAGAVGECHAHVFSCFCSSDSISTPFRLTCPRPCHNKRQASNNKSNEQTNKEPRLKSQWKRIYDALESLSENK